MAGSLTASCILGRRAAGALAGLGVRAGDRVGIISRNHVAHFDLLFAAPLLGFI